MSFTRYNHLNWNNLPAEDLNNVQLNVKQSIKDFLANILNIGFGQGGWKNITFSSNGANAVNVMYGQWATIVQDHMIATPAQGTVVLTSFAATTSGERQDLIAARVYEFENRTKIPYTVYQEVELRRVEAATPNAFGLVAVGNDIYQVLAKVVCDTTGIKSITPYANEPRIDTRNVDGTELRNGQRENLYEALKRLEQMIANINVGGGDPLPTNPDVDLSPFVKKSSFAMLTGTISQAIATSGSGGSITWTLDGLFPKHSPAMLCCEVNQIVVVGSIQRRVYRPHKDWMPTSYVECWETVNKVSAPNTDEPAEKIVFTAGGTNPRGQGLYVRVFAVIEDGLYYGTGTDGLPQNVRFVQVT